MIVFYIETKLTLSILHLKRIKHGHWLRTPKEKSLCSITYVAKNSIQGHLVLCDFRGYRLSQLLIERGKSSKFVLNKGYPFESLLFFHGFQSSCKVTDRVGIFLGCPWSSVQQRLTLSRSQMNQDDTEHHRHSHEAQSGPS